MAKLPKLQHVKFVRSKGRVYPYFNTGQKKDGKVIYARLPAYSSPGFFDAYAALKAGRTKRQAVEYTIAKFVDEYLASRELAKRAPATVKLYTIQLDKLTERLGKYAANRLEAKHIQTILDNEDWGAATRNAFVYSIGALYKWGRKNSKTTLEPVKDFPREITGQHQPWPEHVLQAALEADDEIVRLGVHLLYYAGQRIGDTCSMRWTDIRDDILHVKQGKTGTELEIHLHSELKAELARTRRRALTILSMPEGGRIKADLLRDRLQAFTRAMGAETVPHGLRKNAVNALLEAGCTLHEVASITGQSTQMVNHYAAKVNKRALSKAAMLKFEARKSGGNKA